MSEWISVDQLMPETHTHVLISDGEYVVVASINMFEEWADDDCWAYTPTHWMPIPEPPKC